MNILCYRYGSIVEPDIIDGFKELGNQVSEICLEIYNKNTTPLEGLTALKDELMRHSYDFVFSINFYPFIAEVCNIFQIRYLCLTVDAPVLELFSNSIRLPWNRIFLFDRAQYEDFHPLNPECIFHLPLAGNPARYVSVIRNATPDLIRKYSADISFVGSLYTEKCPYDRLQTEDAYLKGYLEGIMDAQMQLPGCYLLEELLPDIIVDSFRDAMPHSTFRPRIPGARAVLWLRNTICVPRSLPQSASPSQLTCSRYPVCLYTGSGTTGLPVKNCGRVKTHTQMPLVFANSKINLNITSRSIRDRASTPLSMFSLPEGSCSRMPRVNCRTVFRSARISTASLVRMICLPRWNITCPMTRTVQRLHTTVLKKFKNTITYPGTAAADDCTGLRSFLDGGFYANFIFRLTGFCQTGYDRRLYRLRHYLRPLFS